MMLVGHRVTHNGAEICEVLKISERSEEKFSEFSQISCCTQCRSASEGTSTTRDVISAPLPRSAEAKRRHCGATVWVLPKAGRFSTTVDLKNQNSFKYKSVIEVRHPPLLAIPCCVLWFYSSSFSTVANFRLVCSKNGFNLFSAKSIYS